MGRRATGEEGVMGVAPAVVMITKDRPESAVAAVRRLRDLPERPEVIVVDNGSAEPGNATARALHGIEGVTVLQPGRNLGSAGRNLGVEHASTPFVAFSDDDSWWAPGSLARAAAVLAEHPRLAVLIAQTVVGPEERDDVINAELAAAPFGQEADLPGPTAVG